jgi:hypothetical protein
VFLVGIVLSCFGLGVFAIKKFFLLTVTHPPLLKSAPPRQSSPAHIPCPHPGSPPESLPQLAGLLSSRLSYFGRGFFGRFLLPRSVASGYAFRALWR